MTRKKKIKAMLVAGLFLLALGGWLLHFRIHPLSRDSENFIPFVSGIVSVLCLPLLFWFSKTVALAYVINGFLAILGTIVMAHFSITRFQGPVTVASIIFTTTLADIAILWAKFALGKTLFELEYLKSETDLAAKGRFFRYPNMGWWWAHLFGIAAIYALGNILWK